ncbi:hypothetical protein JX266_011911 [Neoarthrinium moseri]|nr:hypothetical protein JX266_011911 [Neoarthrinium moseri]
MAILESGLLDLSSWNARILAFGAGTALHLFLFRFGEWDTWTTSLIGSFVSLQLLSVATLMHLLPDTYASPLTAAAAVSGLAWSMLLGIWSSMLVYRAFFHRLNRFPGPFRARLSNLYITTLSAKKLHLYNEVQQLHKTYGDVVRIVASKSAVSAILGTQSTCVKGPWYNILYPVVSLQMVRNKADHIPRRKVWDRGFGAKALREYEPRVVDYTEQLMAQLLKREGSPVNVTDWFNFYSFDVMGDLAWGKSFGMLRDGVKHYFMKTLHADMVNVGIFSHLVWLFPIFKATPILNAESKRFWRWIEQQVAERRKMKPDRPDVFSWLLEHHESKPKPTAQEELDLHGDAYLIAVAGSDTTAASLTCLFYELARNPDALRTLQREVDELHETSENVDGTALGKLKYLDAVINEALRLHPPVPSGVQRMTPPEGVTIDNTFIPGNSIVQVPSYTMFRDDRYFTNANEFIPERWTTQKELTKNESVFVPFSTGRYSCIGKYLGLMEVRHVTARIVRQYDIKFAPGQDPAAFVEGKRDTFTLALAPLDLVFTRRRHDSKAAGLE